RGPRKASNGEYPLHPFLFALASVLALLANGLDQASLADAAPALLGAFAFAGAVYLLVALARRRFDTAAAMIAGIWVVGCLYYLHLFQPLNRMLGGGFSMVKTLPVVVVLLVLLTVVAVLLARWLRPVNIVLNIIALTMVAVPLWETAAY